MLNPHEGDRVNISLLYEDAVTLLSELEQCEITIKLYLPVLFYLYQKLKKLGLNHAEEV
jgi:hypothetical protein